MGRHQNTGRAIELEPPTFLRWLWPTHSQRGTRLGVLAARAPASACLNRRGQLETAFPNIYTFTLLNLEFQKTPRCAVLSVQTAELCISPLVFCFARRSTGSQSLPRSLAVSRAAHAAHAERSAVVSSAT